MTTSQYPLGGYSNLGPTPGILSTPQKTYSSMQPVNIQANAKKNAEALLQPKKSGGIGRAIYNGMLNIGNHILNAGSNTEKPTVTSKSSISPFSLQPSSYNSNVYNPINPSGSDTQTTGTNPGLKHSSPTTAVKSQTTGADGSQTTTYHAPAPIDTSKTTPTGTTPTTPNTIRNQYSINE